jgi:hypothetical protein
MSQSRNSPIKVKAAHRRAEALRLRMEGKTYEQIGQELGVGTTRAFQLVGDALEQFKVVNTEQADIFRAKLTYELEQLALAVWPKAKTGDPKSAAVLVQIIARLARLQGLDRPAKIAVEAGVTRLDRMSESELVEYARRLDILPAEGVNDVH